MRICSYDEVDPYEVYKLGMIAFGWPITPKYVEHRLREDPRVIDGFAIYAVEGETVVSQVVPLKMTVRLTSGEEMVGGIQGVCSLPGVWGKGYARRLMERSHEMYRELGLRITTLTTSRNIRGYGIYRKMGYTELPPLYQASRPLPPRRQKPQGIRFRPATEADLPTIQAFYEEHTSDHYGWSCRHPRLLQMKFAWDQKMIKPYRIVMRNDVEVGYVRQPGQGTLTDEPVIPDIQDFEEAVGALESEAKGGFACVNDISSARDQERFITLGYDVSGPLMGKVMAMSLLSAPRTEELPSLFGSEEGRFVFYPTDGF